MYRARGPASNAGKNVQCIHTSVVAGTTLRECTQDWLMGNCGKNQAYSLDAFNETGITTIAQDTAQFEGENHNACYMFYVSSFENAFPAIKNKCCIDMLRAANPIPDNYNMGYLQKNKGYIL